MLDRSRTLQHPCSSAVLWYEEHALYMSGFRREGEGAAATMVALLKESGGEGRIAEKSWPRVACIPTVCDESNDRWCCTYVAVDVIVSLGQVADGTEQCGECANSALTQDSAGDSASYKHHQISEHKEGRRGPPVEVNTQI